MIVRCPMTGDHDHILLTEIPSCGTSAEIRRPIPHHQRSFHDQLRYFGRYGKSQTKNRDFGDRVGHHRRGDGPLHQNPLTMIARSGTWNSDRTDNLMGVEFQDHPSFPEDILSSMIPHKKPCNDSSDKYRYTVDQRAVFCFGRCKQMEQFIGFVYHGAALLWNYCWSELS